MFDKVKTGTVQKWPVPVLHYSSDSVSVVCVSLCVVLLSEILSLKIKDVKITNAIGTFAFFIVFYAFYNLPFLGFANSFGIQNSIGTLFLFSFTSK